ncbi:MAG: hypothetical protein ABSG36_18680, partial [Acidimicrobiales bacterium]
MLLFSLFGAPSPGALVRAWTRINGSQVTSVQALEPMEPLDPFGVPGCERGQLTRVEIITA